MGLRIEIDEAIRRASRNAELEALGLVEGEFPNPYDETIEALEEGLKRARFLKSHSHEWGEDEYCVHCGADGRA